MKHISAILRIAIITLLIALGTTSCNKQRVRERVMNKVGIEALENISGSMAVGTSHFASRTRRHTRQLFQTVWATFSSRAARSPHCV